MHTSGLQCLDNADGHQIIVGNHGCRPGIKPENLGAGREAPIEMTIALKHSADLQTHFPDVSQIFITTDGIRLQIVARG